MIRRTGIALAACSVALLPFTTDAQSTEEGLTALGVYDSGAGEGGSEIVAVDTDSTRLFTTNGADGTIDVVDFSDPTAPVLVTQLDISPYGDGIQSVAVGDGVIAAAVSAADPRDPGVVVVFTTDGTFVQNYTVGNLPDSIAFTPDGTKIVVANEGEPICDADDDTLLDVDPDGTISIIDTTNDTVATADFLAFNGTEDALTANGIRVFFPGSTASQDLEPEYVAIDDSGATAYITLQENNAIAVVDINTATVTSLLPLGYKDHSVEGNGLDTSDRDATESIELRDVLGMYMPDAIAVADIGGAGYLVTANEGDARDYACYSEEIRIEDVGLAQPPYSATDGNEDQLGRLKTTDAFPSTFEADGTLGQAYSYGARSFTIWDTAGSVVFDSGDEFEQRLLGTEFFNLDDDETDGRSDDKGPEPEALAVGAVGDRTFAFVGLERAGGVMMYDITDPAAATFVDYVNTAATTAGTDNALVIGGGDVSPEGIAFIPAADSPSGEALIAVSFEVSGTTRLFQVDVDDAGAPGATEPTTTETTTTAPEIDDPNAVPPVTTTPPTPATPNPTGELPATGSANDSLAWIAALLLGAGLSIVAITRRRPLG